MLVFVDQAKWVKVLRTTADASGRATRAMLGLLPKRDMQIPPALMEKLNPEELAQLNRMREIRQSADLFRLRSQAQKFPVTAREVIDHFARSTDAVERALIATTVLDALRRIRIAEREKNKAGNPPSRKGRPKKIRPSS